MSTTARKARKRAGERFERTPKIRTVAYTSRSHRQQLAREANELRKAEIAKKFHRNPIATIAGVGETLKSLPRKGAR